MTGGPVAGSLKRAMVASRRASIALGVATMLVGGLLLAPVGDSIAGASSPASPPWSGWGNAPAGTHQSADKAISAGNVTGLQTSWSFGPCNSRPGVPAVAGGIAYIPDCGSVTAMDVSTDLPVWTSPDIDSTVDTPTIVGKRLFIATTDSTVVALSLSTGQVLWTSTVLPAGALSAVTPMGSDILLIDGGDVLALAQATGGRKWTFTPPAWLSNGNLSEPAVSGASAYIVSNWFIFSLTAQGDLAWEAPINNADGYNSWDPCCTSDPLVSGHMVYAWAMSGDGGAELEGVATTGPPVKVDPKNVSADVCYAVWCINGSWGSGDLAMENGTLFGIFDNDLSAYNGLTGAVVWNGPGDWGSSGPTVANGLVFVSGGTYDAATGDQIGTSPSGCATPIAISGADLFCGTWSEWGVLQDYGFGVVPTFTSSSSAAFTYQTKQSFDVTTAAWPSPPKSTVITAKGALPPGLKFKDDKDGSGVIAGTPTCSGSGCSDMNTYRVTLSAVDGEFSAQQVLTITVS